VAYPALDALKEKYEVYVVVDAIAGVSRVAHKCAIERMIQAGAAPITTLALACELQRDWARGHGDTLRKILQWYFRELSKVSEMIPPPPSKEVGSVSQQNASH
jgi:nicotinamidase-related amidase